MYETRRRGAALALPRTDKSAEVFMFASPAKLPRLRSTSVLKLLVDDVYPDDVFLSPTDSGSNSETNTSIRTRLLFTIFPNDQKQNEKTDTLRTFSWSCRSCSCIQNGESCNVISFTDSFFNSIDEEDDDKHVTPSPRVKQTISWTTWFTTSLVHETTLS